jgi:eukaryotic-like serine/threonine-protein kinase
VLWELLTGHQYLQIAGLDPAAALSVVRHPKPTPPSTRAPWVTPSLDSVVMHALSPDRSKRFPTAEEFRLALSDAITEAAPRTDAARVSELMHAIYQKAMAEEAAERDRFLREVLPGFRAATTPSPDDEAKKAADPKAAKNGAANGASNDAKNDAKNGAAKPAAEDPAKRRQSRRDAALKVLADLAAEDAAAERK